MTVPARGRPHSQSTSLWMLSLLLMFATLITGEVRGGDSIRVRADQVIYPPEGHGVARVQLEGVQQPSSGTLVLKPTLEYGTAGRLALADVPVADGNRSTVEIPFSIPAGAWGCMLRVELYRQDKPVAEAHDVFAAGTNPFRLGQEQVGGTSDLSEAASRQFEGDDAYWPGQWRDTKGTWIEIYCAQPTEVVGLATDWEHWISMQDRYRRSKKAIRALTESAHRLGLKVLMYNNATPSGWVGTEWARKHPEWLAYNYTGGMLGHAAKLYVEDLEKMKTWHETMDPGPRPAERWRGFQPFLLAFGADPALTNFASDQMLAACADLGYDGVRFDGHWSIGQFWTTLGYDIRGRRLNHGQSVDRANTRILRQTKDYIAEQKPDFMYGYNYGLNYEYAAAKEPETFREACANGGMILFEGAMFDGAHSDWRIGAKAMRDAALRVHQAGGTLYGQARMLHAADTFPLNDFSVRYCLITNFAATSHIYGGAYPDHPSYSPLLEIYYHFALRFGELLYDEKLRPIAHPEQQLQVTVDGKEHSDLWWKLYTYKRQLGDNRFQIITHLVNMPAAGVTKETSTPDKQPPPINNVLLTFARDPERLYVLDPEQENWIEEQPARRTLNIPQLKNWKIVVQEFTGNCDDIPAEVFPDTSFDGKDIAPDPQDGKVIFPISSFARGEEGTYLVKDEQAMLGQALHCTAARLEEPLFIMDGPRQECASILAPGRAKLTLRLKVGGNHGANPVFEVSGPFETKTIACNAFKNVRSYQTFAYEFDVQEGVSSYMTMRYFGGTDLWIDSIVVEQLSLAKDRDRNTIGELNPAKSPLRAARTRKVHIVRGLWHDYFGFDKAIEEVAMESSSSWEIMSSHQSQVPTGFPPSVDEMLQYDLIAILNIASDELLPKNRANLRDYVLRGGTLFVGGGTRAFGHGGYANTLLAELLPVELTSRDLTKAEGEAQLIEANENHELTQGLTRSSKPREDPFSFATAQDVKELAPRNVYRHAVKAKPKSTVLLQSAGQPILTVWKFGHGTVYAMTGTPLGETAPGDLAWWNWKGWNTLLVRILNAAATTPDK